MTNDTLEFRSKQQRESEVDLVRNYRDIAIPAIAAASQACRKSTNAAKAPSARVSMTPAE